MTFHSVENLYHLSFFMYFLNCHKPHPFSIQKESYTLERIAFPLQESLNASTKRCAFGIFRRNNKQEKTVSKYISFTPIGQKVCYWSGSRIFFILFFLSIRHFCHFYSHLSLSLFFFSLMFLFSISTMFFVLYFCCFLTPA